MIPVKLQINVSTNLTQPDSDLSNGHRINRTIENSLVN